MFAESTARKSKRQYNGLLNQQAKQLQVAIDWSKFSQLIQDSELDASQFEDNATRVAASEKLTRFISSTLSKSISQKPVSIIEKVHLLWTEAAALVISMTYLIFVIALLASSLYCSISIVAGDWINNTPIQLGLFTLIMFVSLGSIPFLVKPLFGGYQKFHGQVLHKEDAEPLFQLVATLAKAYKIKEPVRIELNNDTKLKIEAVGGYNGVLKGKYKMIIGAPLLAGLNVEQLACLIVHEVVHYNRKERALAYYILHGVNQWLHFRASGNDAWQVSVKRILMHEMLSPLKTTVYLSIYKAQRLIQFAFVVLYRFNRLVNKGGSLRLERVADEAAAQLVGSQGFEECVRRLRILQDVQMSVKSANNFAWNEGMLLDNYSVALSLAAKQISPLQLQKIEKQFAERQSSLYPMDTVRFKNARGVKSSALFKMKANASLLVKNFNVLSRQLTLLEYQIEGVQRPEEHLTPSNTVLSVKKQVEIHGRCISEYFDGRYQSRILSFSKLNDPGVDSLDLQSTIDYIRQYRVDDHKYQHQYQTLEKQIFDLNTDQLYRESGMRRRRHRVSNSLPKDGKSRSVILESRQNDCKKYIERQDRLFCQRALLLMPLIPNVEQKLLEAPISNLMRMTQYADDILSLSLETERLSNIRSAMGSRISRRHKRLLVLQKHQAWKQLQDILQLMKRSQIQVKSNRGDLSLYRYVMDRIGRVPPSSKELTVEEVLLKLYKAVESLDYQYKKWLGQVAYRCRHYENQLDIVPIKRVA